MATDELQLFTDDRFLFRATDLEEATTSPTGLAHMAIFLQATRSQFGSLAVLIFVLALQLSCSVGVMAAVLRMTWSFARDRGLPGWKSISKIPLESVLITATISVLLSLIILISVTAFSNLMAMSVVGLYLSYLIATALLLYRRLTGIIRSERRYENDMINTVGVQPAWGPWRMQKYIGVAVNMYAYIWAAIMTFFSLWPTTIPVTADNMQCSSVIVSGIILLAVVWYLLYGKTDYHRPVFEPNL